MHSGKNSIFQGWAKKFQHDDCMIQNEYFVNELCLKLFIDPFHEPAQTQHMAIKWATSLR